MPEPVAAAAAGLRSFLTFRVAGRLYALPAEHVLEVIRMPAAARVPESPAALLGIANLRGVVLPLVSLRALLGLPAEPREGVGATATAADAAPATAKAIVIESGAPLALAVDGVATLASVGAERIETRESELGAAEGEMLVGAFPLGEAQGRHDEVAKILDLARLLAVAFAQQARARSKTRSLASAARARAAPAAVSRGATAAMLVSFEVAGQEFALDLAAVQEILPAPAAIAAVPRAESLVIGVTSLRDRLLPLLSLRGLLGFPSASFTDGREKVVVAKVGGANVGLVADRARAILAAEESAIDPVPTVLAARTGGESRLKGIYRGDGGRRLVSILSPEQLFREDVMRRLNENGRNERIRETVAPASVQAELRFLVFRLGSDEYGLPIEAVDEVGELPEKLTRMPKSPKFLAGVVNLRGDVLPVVDQRSRFDMPALAETGRRRIVVVRSERMRAGLIVDSVADVLRVPADSLEPAPDLTDGIARLVRGVINLAQSQRMILVLDPSELLTPAERGRLDAFRQASKANA